MHIAAGHDIEEACGMALEQLSGIEVDPGLATLSGQLLARMIRRDYGVERDATDLALCADTLATTRSEEHTSALQSLMRRSYADLRFIQKNTTRTQSAY